MEKECSHDIEAADHQQAKNELERIYPGYLPVATVPNMLDLNINAVAKELIKEEK